MATRRDPGCTSASSKTGGHMTPPKACAKPRSRLAASLADLRQNLGNELLLTALGRAGAHAETVIVTTCSWHELRRSTAKPSGRSTLTDQCWRGVSAIHGTAPQEARAAPPPRADSLMDRQRAGPFYLGLRLSRSLTRPAPTVRLRLSARVKHRSRRPWCK